MLGLKTRVLGPRDCFSETCGASLAADARLRTSGFGRETGEGSEECASEGL